MPVSYILLAHNEAETIEREIRSIHGLVISRLPGSELIVAEDGSRDGTRGVIERLRGELPFRLIGGESRKGYARAVADAVAAASMPAVFVTDGGLKHDPGDFWRLWDVRDTADIVVGWKRGRSDALFRRALTWCLNFLLRSRYRVPVHDADCGFRLYDRRVVDDIVASGLRFRGFVSAEIILRALHAGLRVAEVPVSYRQRRGESRGLPLRTMPRAVLRLIADLRELRREWRHPSA